MHPPLFLSLSLETTRRDYPTAWRHVTKRTNIFPSTRKNILKEPLLRKSRIVYLPVIEAQ